MDLGIRGRKALVCGASEGLGFACAKFLAAAGVELTIVARRSGPVEDAAAELEKLYKVPVKAVPTDITNEDGRAEVLVACPAPDIVVTNAGGPPTGDFRDWDRDTWIAALDANMLTPIELIKATFDGMVERRFGRIVNITSGMVKMPTPILGLSNGARTGLTGFVAGIARLGAGRNVTINNLLPGSFETRRLYATLEGQAKAKGISLEAAAEERKKGIPSHRFGDPDEFGATCAFMCSAHAGYMTGQNILIDGGAYPGTF